MPSNTSSPSSTGPRVLLVHKFLRPEGGAESYLFRQAELLQRAGWRVGLLGCQDERNINRGQPVYTVEPPEITAPQGATWWQQLRVTWRSLVNSQAMSAMRQALSEFRPDIVHFHSVYHHLSPSVLEPVRRRGVPSVMTLHDFKLLCPAIRLLDGASRRCMQCQGRFNWHAVQERCFKGSYRASLGVALESQLTRWSRIFERTIRAFLSPSQFLIQAYETAGLLRGRLHHQPYVLLEKDFVHPENDSSPPRTNAVVFAGRLSSEKGIWSLVKAFAHPELRGVELRVLGTGPLEHELQTFVRMHCLQNIRFFGQVDPDSLRHHRLDCALSVVPSISYDNSPLSVYESLAAARPVIGSDLGGIPELIEHGVTGRLVPPGDEAALRNAILESLGDSRWLLTAGRAARRVAERFSATAHLNGLESIYRRVGAI